MCVFVCSMRPSAAVSMCVCVCVCVCTRHVCMSDECEREREREREGDTVKAQLFNYFQSGCLAFNELQC